MLVARRLWDQLGLGEIVTRRWRPLGGLDVADAAFVLTAHRLVHPGSEHALAWWLGESFVADAVGRRIRPQRERRGRVQVGHRQLRLWYQTLDRLLEAKAAIEQDLYLRLRDPFGLQVDLVFCDLTSTYFEGRRPAGLARHGHSRDGHPRDRQVLVGVVMASAWPIASYIDPHLEPLQALSAYKDLQTVERGFRALKDVLAVRPIYHQTPQRVQAHLFVAHLALVLGTALQKALQRAGLTLALETALEALRPIRLVELELPRGSARFITRPTPHGQAVLRAVGIQPLRPPGQPGGKPKSAVQAHQGV